MLRIGCRLQNPSVIASSVPPLAARNGSRRCESGQPLACTTGMPQKSKLLGSLRQSFRGSRASGGPMGANSIDVASGAAVRVPPVGTVFPIRKRPEPEFYLQVILSDRVDTEEPKQLFASTRSQLVEDLECMVIRFQNTTRPNVYADDLIEILALSVWKLKVSLIDKHQIRTLLMTINRLIEYLFDLQTEIDRLKRSVLISLCCHGILFASKLISPVGLTVTILRNLIAFLDLCLDEESEKADGPNRTPPPWLVRPDWICIPVLKILACSITKLDWEKLENPVLCAFTQYGQRTKRARFSSLVSVMPQLTQSEHRVVFLRLINRLLPDSRETSKNGT
ncbi:hypothetical protein FBUS_05221 [Fasciolopsis buskii]|uniref:Uncharacterized protein n=1 Tax=Fasciolopsis buskii TaxID=27845 RepID=A0A8E0VKK2_9TREM|nr:hypothetical protein FBUS_05221 [Fasciolopsis buski]